MAKLYCITAVSSFFDIKSLAEDLNEHFNIISLDIAKVRIRGVVGISVLDQSKEHGQLTIIADQNNHQKIFSQNKLWADL